MRLAKGLAGGGLFLFEGGEARFFEVFQFGEGEGGFFGGACFGGGGIVAVGSLGGVDFVVFVIVGRGKD